MSWIETIDYADAKGKLKKIYNRVKGPGSNIDNVLKLHSLRPHTLSGHMTLYKSVLHHSGNSLPKWYLEALGIYVSHLNNCSYCVDHHFEGFKRLLKDDNRANEFLRQIKNDKVETFFEAPYSAGFIYAKKLTLSIQLISKKDFDAAKSAGFSDGELLEINQVTSYFNYVNRSVLGLGIITEGDILGLSPNNSDDSENWNHD